MILLAPDQTPNGSLDRPSCKKDASPLLYKCIYSNTLNKNLANYINACQCYIILWIQHMYQMLIRYLYF